MYILGYSGLHGIKAFRNSKFNQMSQLDENIFQGMDAAACLLHNGNVIAAAEEERFIDEKHTCHFPVNAIKFCLDTANITMNDIETICHGFNYDLYRDLYTKDTYSQDIFANILSSNAQIMVIRQFFPDWHKIAAFKSVEHHLAHAASAYYMSGLNNALVVVADGMGEIHSMSAYSASENRLTKIANFDLLSSLGMFYSLVTAHLGFKPNDDEYKVMGLAPYGNKEAFQDAFQELILLESDGEIVIPSLLENDAAIKAYSFAGSMKKIATMIGRPRKQKDELLQSHKDIACALQARLNEAMLHFISYWQKETGHKNLCLAGGVALNCVTNSAIADTTIFNNIYIQPAAGDAGTALGAAMHTYNNHFSEPPIAATLKTNTTNLPLFGPNNDDFFPGNLPPNLLKKLKISQLEINELMDITARAIFDNKVVGWVSGNMEFGPRA